MSIIRGWTVDSGQKTYYYVRRKTERGARTQRVSLEEFRTLMARHHDITQKLQLLCLESVLEKDPQKQVFMWKHVDTMAGVRAELDKHIASMTTILSVS